ncbi:hypothetical protein K501DRAFT_303334 [Backusella circina FSU 941]|nr:hypothetical protein K501DRAFT_303334 [Backusella circina FSU 941]
MRSNQTMDVMSNDLTLTKSVAGQAASMTHFFRSFRSLGSSSTRTPTPTQEDIYSLESDLGKLLQQFYAKSQYGHFTDPHAMTLSYTEDQTKRPLRQSLTDIFSGNTSPISETVDNDFFPHSESHIHITLTKLMDIMARNRSANELPFPGEVLAILSIPFDRVHIDEMECLHALDVFDYTRSRFTLSDPTSRVFSILDDLFLRCSETEDSLLSSPLALQSLVYNLTNALAQLTIHGNQGQKKIIYIRSGIVRLLDSISTGRLLPLKGRGWYSYYNKTVDDEIPISVSRLCLVEALCKSLMGGTLSQTDPYTGMVELLDNNWIERARDILVMEELFPRYWMEPEEDTKPAYLKIIFLLSELACETFINATLDDLRSKTSTTSLLLPLVVEKLSPNKLKRLLAERDTNSSQRKVAYNVVTMLLCLLSICSLEENPKKANGSNHSSPNLSPKLSVDELDQTSIFSSDLPRNGMTQSMVLTLKGYILEFWNSGYKDIILEVTAEMHQDSSGERVACVYQNLVFNINDRMGEEIARKTLPSLFKRLSETYPPIIPSLTEMLVNLSKRFKLYFYNPVMKCVASDNEMKVAKSLTLISCLRRYMSAVQFWMQDPEMVSIMLLNDVDSLLSASKKQGPRVNIENDEPKWGTTSLGQCAIATEFLWAIKELRSKNPKRDLEEVEVAKKFLIDLERRLSVFLTAKEKLHMIPMPLRVILCNIFLDLRFFCGTTHRPGWLNCVINWAIQPVIPATQPFNLAQKEDVSPSKSQESNTLWLDSHDFENVNIMFTRIKSVYLTVIGELQYETFDSSDHRHRRESMIPPEPAKPDPSSIEVPRYKRHEAISTMYPISYNSAMALDLDPPVLSDNYNEAESGGPASKISKYRYYHMNEINQDVFGSILSLLAAVFATLSNPEFGRLVRPLWERFIDDRKPQSFLPAGFLFLECAEKIPKTVIEHSSLSAFRFNALNQEYIHISSRKRPFRGEGGAFSTPFVPTDLGSSQFAFDEPRWIAKLKNAGNLPPELKRQIQELGWNDANHAEENEALKKVLTPLALLPSLFLEEEDEEKTMNGNDTERHGKKVVSINRIINRRKRIATIMSMTVSFMSMIDLLNDNYGGASSALHEMLEYFLRDDPTLFLRPFLNDLGSFKFFRCRDIFTRIRHLISIQHKLPPGFTHVLFNHLTGMLKWMAREPKYKDRALTMMTLIHPVLSELVFSSNDLTLRDLRKSKVEHLLISTGNFWFTHEQPMDMFPRGPSNNMTPFSLLNIQMEVFLVAMLRISHIQFLTNYLVRYPREVYAVKRILQDYESILNSNKKRRRRWSIHENHFPNLRHRKRRSSSLYLYGHEDTRDESTPKASPSQQRVDTEAIAVLRARIWLKFMDSLLYGLNKNYNDYDELERIFQSINTILCEHSHDFSIISQVLTLLTRVVTRFKRLFMSNRGYTIFLPVLFKIFCELDHLPEIRSAIQFAWCRFYAVHEESFVFQMLGTLVPILLNALNQSEELGIWMIDNLFELMECMDAPQTNDIHDILGIKLQVEIDDHERSILERIDAASNTMAIPLSTNLFQTFAKSFRAPIKQHIAINNYSNRPYPIENFVKLFITIIAYDPGSIRAEQFVKLFRYLLPRFYRTAPLKPLIEEGISALIDVFSRFTKHSLFNDERLHFQGESGAQHAYGKQWPQNDRLSCKKEFVRLVQAYFKQNGVLADTDHEKMAMVIKHILRDYSTIKGIVCPTDWIKEYLEDCIYGIADMRNYSRILKKMLVQITAQYRAQWKTVDGSGLIHGLAILLEQGQSSKASMNELAGFIQEKYISFGLAVGTRHKWGANTEGRKTFCNALVHLFIAILENSTQDVISDMKNQRPSIRLMSDIFIPFCLHYYLPLEYSDTTNRFRPDPSIVWVRLLAYASNIFSQASSLLRNKSQGFSLAQHLKNHQVNFQDDLFDIPEQPKITPRTMPFLYAFSLVAIKMILVRGASTFDNLMGSWAQIAYMIKDTLEFGQSQQQQHTGSGLIPCLYDFVMWRFLEFVVQQERSPLYVFLVGFIHNKLLAQTISPVNYSPSAISTSSVGAGLSKKNKKTKWKSWAGLSPPSSSTNSPINFQQQQQCSTMDSEEIHLNTLRIDSISYLQMKMGFRPFCIPMGREGNVLSRIKDEWQLFIRLSEL